MLRNVTGGVAGAGAGLQCMTDCRYMNMTTCTPHPPPNKQGI